MHILVCRNCRRFSGRVWGKRWYSSNLLKKKRIVEHDFDRELIIFNGGNGLIMWHFSFKREDEKLTVTPFRPCPIFLHQLDSHQPFQKPRCLPAKRPSRLRNSPAVCRQHGTHDPDSTRRRRCPRHQCSTIHARRGALVCRLGLLLLVVAGLELLLILDEILAQRGVGLGIGWVDGGVVGAHAKGYEAAPFDVRFRLANASSAKTVFFTTVAAVAWTVRVNGGPGSDADDRLFVVFMPRLRLGELPRIQNVSETGLKCAAGRDGCGVVDGDGFTAHVQRQFGGEKEYARKVMVVFWRRRRVEQGRDKSPETRLEPGKGGDKFRGERAVVGGEEGVDGTSAHFLAGEAYEWGESEPNAFWGEGI